MIQSGTEVSVLKAMLFYMIVTNEIGEVTLPLRTECQQTGYVWKQVAKSALAMYDP